MIDRSFRRVVARRSRLHQERPVARLRQHHLSRRLIEAGHQAGGLGTPIVVLLVILGAALQTRVAMVRNFPQTASLFAAIGLPLNLRGLISENVKSAGEFVDGVTVMVVQGAIVNLTGKTLEVPRLVAADLHAFDLLRLRVDAITRCEGSTP